METVTEPTLLLYINSASVVLGKHQNPFKQVNVPHCLKNGISICRRYSGGGTVYHDSGNLNYAFIDVRSPESFGIDYDCYTLPIRDFLRSYGLNAQVSARHDLLIDAFKISGTAQHLHQKRKVVLHHGTLLINTKLDQLGDALKPKDLGIEDSSIDSVRSQVINLNEYISSWTPTTVMNLLSEYFSTSGNPLTVDPSQMDEVSTLIDHRYQTEAWNFGYSPKFILPIGNELITVSNGLIDETGWPISPTPLSQLAFSNPKAQAIYDVLYG